MAVLSSVRGVGTERHSQWLLQKRTSKSAPVSKEEATLNLVGTAHAVRRRPDRRLADIAAAGGLPTALPRRRRLKVR